jgi:hypothetical protein
MKILACSARILAFGIVLGLVNLVQMDVISVVLIVLVIVSLVILGITWKVALASVVLLGVKLVIVEIAPVVMKGSELFRENVRSVLMGA